MVDLTKIVEEKLREKGIKLRLYPQQKEMIRTMFEALKEKGVVFVGQGPPGMGKTYVIAAVVLGLTNLNKRICIAVPTYTHLKDVMIKHLEKLDLNYSIIRGLSALKEEMGEGCPLKGGKKPSPIFCDPESERCRNVNCTVKKEKENAEKAQIVVTVFHKLLTKPSLLNKFDVVIFDESHGLETKVRSFRIVKFKSADLEILSNFSSEHKDLVKEILQEFIRLRKRVDTEIPYTFVERRIATPLKDILHEVKKELIEREEKEGFYNEEVFNAYFTLDWAVKSTEKAGLYRYIFHKETDAILGIPYKITFVPLYDEKTGKETSIALISATIESPKLHAKDSGFPEHKLAPPVQISNGEFVKRFLKRPIFGLIDGPILRYNPRDIESYNLAREEANKIIGAFLPKFKFPVLILCRNRSDARSIEQYLKGIKGIRDRVYLFDYENTFRDIDALEEEINREIDRGKNIILTSASSRLWEGVNIKGLKMLIVDALPYVAPEPYDKFEKRGWSSWRTSRTFRFMIRRLQQGIGRLIRTEEDKWGIVVVIDGRFNAQWNTIKSALPKYMKHPKIIRFVPRARLALEVMKTVKKFLKADNKLQ